MASVKVNIILSDETIKKVFDKGIRRGGYRGLTSKKSRIRRKVFNMLLQDLIDEFCADFLKENKQCY